MTDDLEKELRRALQPVDPGEEFTRRVMARVPGSSRGTTWRPTWNYAALAASVVLVAMGVIVHERQQQQKEAGLAARAQVLEALHVTSEKLDLAYRLVNTR